jgi:mono/diheme cytochrome c family protein
VFKRRILPLAPLLAAFTVLAAQEVKRVEVRPSMAVTGQQMFNEYCAVCHGTGGQGNGPAADALKKRPADLTQLARKNDGKFPALKVMHYIKGEDEVAAHGNRDMPVWGSLLTSLRPSNPEVAEIRIRMVEQYVESLQAK